MLKFRIGRLNLDRQILLDCECPFVVENRENTVTLYIADADWHREVVERCGLDQGRIVGGGYVSLVGEKDEILRIGGISGNFQAIPEDAARKFGTLLAPEIEKLGFQIRGLKTEKNTEINPFWNS